MLDPDFGVNEEKMHCIGAFIPFWKGRKRFWVSFLGDTFSEHFNNKRTVSIHKSVSNLNRSGFFLFTKVEERGKNGAYDLRVVPKVHDLIPYG